MCGNEQLGILAPFVPGWSLQAEGVDPHQPEQGKRWGKRRWFLQPFKNRHEKKVAKCDRIYFVLYASPPNFDAGSATVISCFLNKVCW